MTKALTSQQRMARMLARQDHDRIPRSDGYWPETIARWQSEGLQGDQQTVFRLLGNDVSGCCWNWPAPFPGQSEVLSEDQDTQVIRGELGAVQRHWKNRWGTPEHISFGCDSREQWFGVYKPALLKARPKIDPAQALRDCARLRSENLFCTFNGIDCFEGMRQMVGDEILLLAMADDPEWVRDMCVTYTDVILRQFQMVLEAGAQADALWIFGDLGYNHGTFFSPRMYDQLIRPDHRRLCDWAHQHGMKFIYHTDGDVRCLLDMFVENGYDCIQPMEAKANMDVRQLAPRYGRRLSFFGNIDMVIAGSGDREALEHEVRTKLQAGMAQRGYAYYSDHSVPPGVSWPTYRFLMELLDRHGRYD